MQAAVAQTLEKMKALTELSGRIQQLMIDAGQWLDDLEPEWIAERQGLRTDVYVHQLIPTAADFSETCYVLNLPFSIRERPERAVELLQLNMTLVATLGASLVLDADLSLGLAMRLSGQALEPEILCEDMRAAMMVAEFTFPEWLAEARRGASAVSAGVASAQASAAKREWNDCSPWKGAPSPRMPPG